MWDACNHTVTQVNSDGEFESALQVGLEALYGGCNGSAEQD